MKVVKASMRVFHRLERQDSKIEYMKWLRTGSKIQL